MNENNMKNFSQTWLLTWNPKRFQDRNPQYCFEELENDLSQIGFAITKWSCGVTTSIKPEDHVYLIRLGEEPRGIVASGRVLSKVFFGTHWDEERRACGVQVKQIYVKFDDIRVNNGVILPIEILKLQFSSVHWSAQASGTSIAPEVAQELHKMWNQNV
ncbi:MAG: hypothetical protein ACOX6Y_05885 [Christensenellales bacterium]|jgi:hypothetical protein